MKSKIKLFFFISTLIGVIVTIHFFISQYQSDEDFFNEAVNNSFTRSYDGTVINKFISGARKKIVLDNGTLKTEIDFIYEKFDIYEIIKLGDTLIKNENSLNLELKSKNFDTIIQFKFEHIKGNEKYRSPLEIVNSSK